MREKGQVEITHLASVGVITIILSIVGSIAVGGKTWGTVTEKIDRLEKEQTLIREEVKYIPGMKEQIEWIVDRLDQIANKVGAPPAKQ